MATETKDFVTDMFNQATESFNRTMSTGLEFQQQAGKFWGDVFEKSFDQVRTHTEKVSKDFVPGAKKNVEQFHKMFDGQAQKSLDMLRKTFESGECCNVQDLSDQTVKMWQTSFDTVRSQVDAMAKMNVEMFESFSDMANKTFVDGQKCAAKPASK